MSISVDVLPRPVLMPVEGAPMGLTDGVLRVSRFGLIFRLTSALRRRSRSVLEMGGGRIDTVRARVCNVGAEHFLMSPLSEGSIHNEN